MCTFTSRAAAKVWLAGIQLWFHAINAQLGFCCISCASGHEHYSSRRHRGTDQRSQSGHFTDVGRKVIWILWHSRQAETEGGSNGFSASMHQYWPILCCLFLHMCLLLIRKKPLISFYHVCHSKGGSFRRWRIWLCEEPLVDVQCFSFAWPLWIMFMVFRSTYRLQVA